MQRLLDGKCLVNRQAEKSSSVCREHRYFDEEGRNYTVNCASLSPIMPATPSHLRSMYRSILRELPHRPLSAPSPIQQRIRSSFSLDTTAQPQVEEAEQYIQYVKAQRMYATLLERYNPGMGMDEEERVRLTARRVGMDMPEEWYGGKKN